MKKLISVALACATLATSLVFAGCSKNAEVKTPDDFVAPYSQYDLTEYVKLADYSVVEYTPLDTTVTDDMLDERLATELEEYASVEIVEDRGARMGDTVVINYHGIMDGEPLENGSATEQSLTLGSGQFIDGFEEGLVGAKTGDTVKLNLTFPDPYPNNPDLSGKPVEFTVLVRYIKGKVIPDLSDELVQNITDGEYQTVAEYRESFIPVIRAELEEEAELQKQSEACGSLLTASEIIALPEEKLNEYTESVTSYYTDAAEAYDMTLEELLGIDEETFNTQIKAMVEQQVRQEVLLYAVVQAENLKLTQTEYDEGVAEFAEESDMTVEEAEEQYEFVDLWDMMMRQKTMEFIADKATAVEKTDTAADTTADTAATE